MTNRKLITELNIGSNRPKVKFKLKDENRLRDVIVVDYNLGHVGYYDTGSLMKFSKMDEVESWLKYIDGVYVQRYGLADGGLYEGDIVQVKTEDINHFWLIYFGDSDNGDGCETARYNTWCMYSLLSHSKYTFNSRDIQRYGNVIGNVLIDDINKIDYGR
jgi:hypothetical protein